MSEIIINDKEVVDDVRLMPADEWNIYNNAQLSTQKWFGRLLFLLCIFQTLIFGPWIALCPTCELFSADRLISLFNYVTLSAILLSFMITVCFFCYVEAAITFFAAHKCAINVLSWLPISTFLTMTIFMFWHRVFSHNISFEDKAWKCLGIEGILCGLCVASGIVSRRLLVSQKDCSVDIHSFHSGSVIIEQG